MAAAEHDAVPAEPAGSSVPADEETPLLGGQATNGPVGDAEDAEVTLIPDEPSNKKLALIMSTLWVGVILGALDSTVIATLSAPISTSFNSLNLLSWVATAYLIANAACQPISGRLTDIYSRRTGLVLSNVLFAAGNLMCGLATTEWTMIGGRVVAGMGGGGLMAINTFVASDLVPLRKRGLIQGLGNICYGAGAGLGGLFGGWVNDVWGWRTAFLSQVPLVVLSAILVYFVVDVPPKKSDKSKLSRVDFLGALTLVVFLILLLLGLNSGGNIVPWTHPLVLVTLPLSAVVFALFIYVEAYWAKEPVIPVRLFLNRTVVAACLCNWWLTGVTYMFLFYTPIYFQVKGLSTTQAGIRLIPQSVGASAGSLAAGLIMNRTGKYIISGLALMLALVTGTGLMSLLNFDSPEWPASVFLFLIGSGYGGMLTVTLLACISAVDHEHQAVITSATYAFRSTGSTIGVTVGSAVYQNVLKTKLWHKFGREEGAADVIRRIRDNFDELHHLPTGWKAGVLDSYEDALRALFLTALGRKPSSKADSGYQQTEDDQVPHHGAGKHNLVSSPSPPKKLDVRLKATRKKQISTLLFDCDNTLVLSEELAFEACAELANEILAAHGVATRYTGPQLLRDFVGQNFRGMMVSLQRKFDYAMSDEELEGYVRREEDQVIGKLEAALRPCAGVDAELAALEASAAPHYTLAVVSSSALRRVRASIDKVGQAKYFGDRVFSAATSLPTPTSKPDPAIYLHALATLGVAAADCCAIEDSRSGATSAVRAGIRTLGYVGSYEPEERDRMAQVLTDAGARVIMRDWSEFRDCLRRIETAA
ncbi:MAG: hypothetical protein M1818_007251 [Claussenomyces sp. TS43310]|nr:MAG: hypothetical protein M1818_007251 [Claussenomyces sp. TS43310]